MQPPKSVSDPYDQKIKGVFGTFGAGMDIRVCFLQAAIDSSELSKIQLVSEIPGSDRWPVRDLFQRDVDTKRVETSILPWLQDEQKVKFFNPLTLTLVPIDENTNNILTEIPKLEQIELEKEDCNWIALERSGYYRFRYMVSEDSESHREYGLVEWNSRRVRLVAIDGQHRLSALKRYLIDERGPGFEGFMGWNIPVVVSGLDTEKSVTASVLDVVRNMFVYINTQAKTPSLSRRILLDDEVIYHVCAQELLQYSHENDTTENPADRVQSRVPLLFYDWRGATENGLAVPAAASLKSVVEIADWLRHYIIGEAAEPIVRAFRVSPEDKLYNGLSSGEVPNSETDLVRQKFRDEILPGLVHLLENFAPYKHYITELRKKEIEWANQSDSYRHALSKLRFGSHRGGPTVEKDIESGFEEIVEELTDLKTKIPLLLQYDIGMRGVVFAFGILKDWREYWIDEDEPIEWKPYAEWFTRNLNRAYEQKWFEAKGNSSRLHVTRNALNNVVNHRIGDASKALGPYLCAVICKNAIVNQDGITEQTQWEDIWENCVTQTLFTTLRSGYQRQLASELKTKHPSWSQKKIKEESNARGNKEAHAHIDRFEHDLEKVTPQ